jgi:serine protease
MLDSCFRKSTAVQALALTLSTGAAFAAPPVDDSHYVHQWGVQKPDAGVRADQAWRLSTGDGITVAVLGAGVSPHVELNAKLQPGFDFISLTWARVGWYWTYDGDGRDLDPSDPGATGCGPVVRTWEGTHVAGIIAAQANNGVGGAGVAFKAKILPVRVSDYCYFEENDLPDAIAWSSGGTPEPSVEGSDPPPTPAPAAQVMVVSPHALGNYGATCHPKVQAAIDGAIARGVTVITGAGFQEEPATPACRGVIMVGANGYDGVQAGFSRDGQVWAPGVDIFSTSGPGDAYAFKSGTFMAAGQVAGVVALVQSRRLKLGLPLLAPAQVASLLATTSRPRTILYGTCTTQPEAGFCGIVDANAAVQAAGSVDVPTPGPLGAPAK